MLGMVSKMHQDGRNVPCSPTAGTDVLEEPSPSDQGIHSCLVPLSSSPALLTK